MESETLELVNDAYTLAIFDNKKILFRINQAFLDRSPDQKEALLATHQCRDHGVIIDNCATCHLRYDGSSGSQSINTPEGTFPFQFDGKKCYFQIRKPSDDDFANYQIVELTSSQPFEPVLRRTSTRLQKQDSGEISTWRANLGYPTYEVTRDTLANTTQMVKTLQSETREYLQDYHKTRIHALCPLQIDDVMYSDTFFASITSI